MGWHGYRIISRLRYHCRQYSTNRWYRTKFPTQNWLRSRPNKTVTTYSINTAFNNGTSSGRIVAVSWMDLTSSFIGNYEFSFWCSRNPSSWLEKFGLDVVSSLQTSPGVSRLQLSRAVLEPVVSISGSRSGFVYCSQPYCY